MQKNRKQMIGRGKSESVLKVLEATCRRFHCSSMRSSFLGKLSVASLPLTFGSASNQRMLLHDVPTATITTTETTNNIKRKYTAFTSR